MKVEFSFNENMKFLFKRCTQSVYIQFGCMEMAVKMRENSCSLFSSCLHYSNILMLYRRNVQPKSVGLAIALEKGRDDEEMCQQFSCLRWKKDIMKNAVG